MRRLLTSFVLAGCVFSQPATATVAHSVGIARDPASRAIQYVEHHQYLPSGAHVVKYFDRSGEVWATKTMTYPGLPQHPQINQSERSGDIEIATSYRDGALEVVRNSAGDIERFELPLDSKTIVDAGFDSYLRSNWQIFRVGEPQFYKLAVVGQEKLLGVQITRQPSDDELTVFTVEPRNFLLRLLVPQIRLAYDQNRRLQAYEGLTNLSLPAGNSRKVSIQFNHYTTANTETAPLPQWVPET